MTTELLPVMAAVAAALANAESAALKEAAPPRGILSQEIVPAEPGAVAPPGIYAARPFTGILVVPPHLGPAMPNPLQGRGGDRRMPHVEPPFELVPRRR